MQLRHSGRVIILFRLDSRLRGNDVYDEVISAEAGIQYNAVRKK
jgi:hypothetical protein